MNVKELIEILETIPPDFPVTAVTTDKVTYVDVILTGNGNYVEVGGS